MFETVFTPAPPPARRALAGPLSIALHAAAIAAVVVGSAWRISDPGEPNVPITLFTSAPPPPPAAPGAAGSPRPKPGSPSSPSTRALARPILLSPSVMPVRIDAAPEPEPLDLPGGETGPGTGSSDGIDGGTGDSGSPAAGMDTAPIAATARNVVPPHLLSQPQPEYPETARRTREQGLVLLQAVIGTSGTIEDLRVLSSTSPLFEEAALHAVRRWRYHPATLAGRAVRVYLTVTIRFRLR